MSTTITQTIQQPPATAGTTSEGGAKPPSKVSQTQVDNAATANNLAVATGGYVFPGIPQIIDPYKKRRWQLEHMAGAFRVFARKGFTEGTSGHISVRDPVDPDTFWINP
ncbi:hypothetical protein H9Q71_001429 [Fusarium xylarioides]|nr:hypothetical protein H9Q71_001429 [Fusarium xylarioides]